MLQIITGPFHPNLEDALVREVKQLKSRDPLASVAIIVPSTLLLTRVRHLLVIESGLSLLNVHFLTFHQLARRLHDEQWGLGYTAQGASPIEPLPDFFFEHLVSHVIQSEMKGINHLHAGKFGPGACSALWATVRDLKDAVVDPRVALQAVEEGLFDSEENDKIGATILLYAAVLEASHKLGAGTFEDLATTVLPWIPASRFLRQLQQVCYYGFYDLTQVQLSLFEAVVKHAPVTLYFPLTDDPEFCFARRFFDRHLSPLVTTSEQVVRAPAHSSWATEGRTHAQVEIISAVGSDDELTAVCKQILTLVETHGYRFNEIGIVARTLGPYHSSLRRICDQHRIPYTTTAASPVIQEPAAKTLLMLASLPLTQFYQRQVLDLLGSPFYRYDAVRNAGIEPRTDLWELAVQSMGIIRGEEDWQRLASMSRLDVWATVGDEAADRGAELVGVDAPQIQLLWRFVQQLIRDCRLLPSEGTYGELSEAFCNLAMKHLAVPGVSKEWHREGEASERLAAIGAAIHESLAQLRQLDRVGGTVGYAEWVRALARLLEEAAIPIALGNHPGVQVLDAMGARGLPFRALFVIGLNENVFPRVIREDAFLRDRHRQVLDATLGYKIDEKLGAYDEEQLLFALLKQAVQTRLYLCYQRADEQGRPLAPSPYVVELLRARTKPDNGAELRVPRRLTDRLDMPLFAPTLMTPGEQVLRLLLQGCDPSPLIGATGGDVAIFQHGLQALQVIEGRSQRPDAYDGVVGALDRHWQFLTTRGVSPTSLEQYARCPFQYFACQVLRLEPVRQLAHEELPAQAVGELCHAVLRACYQQLLGMGWPDRAIDEESTRRVVQACSGDVFKTYAATHGTGYALTWQMAQDLVLELAAAAVRSDEEDYRDTGFAPIAFEVEAEGELKDAQPAKQGPIHVKGRVDRVDRRVTPPGLRIVDYKYRHGRSMQSRDRDLTTSAIRAFRLQPPLYALLTTFHGLQPAVDSITELPQAERVEFLYLAPRWERTTERASFDQACWRKPAGKQLKRTLKILLEGIRAGRYVILPDGYCDSCEFGAVCRQFHGPTWWRAHGSGVVRKLRQIRKAKTSHA